MQNTVLGTCSQCGGAVCVPTVWHGVMPPVPTCANCGATKAAPYGPVIPMKPADNTWNSPDSSAAPKWGFGFYRSIS